MTRYLSSEQVLFIHSRLVEETGGYFGLRDSSMLLSAVGRPQAQFKHKDLYPDIFTKAAALMDSLIRNHPFMDGNKRIGIASAVLFLSIKGYSFQCDQKEVVIQTMNCAKSESDLETLSSWFREHSSQD